MIKLKYLEPEKADKLLKKCHSDLQDFEKSFPHRKACDDRLKEWKWPDGFKCRVCGYDAYSFNRSKFLYECKQCNKQQSLTAGTIFERSKTPLKAWFYMLFVMELTNKRIPRANFLTYLNKIKKTPPGTNHYKSLKRITTIISGLSRKEFDRYLDLVQYHR